jgi:DNA polymerase-3 subunit delta
MVAVKSQQAESFLRAPPPAVCAVLLFGTDPGLVMERAQLLARRMAEAADPPGEVLRLDEADLEGDPDRLAVELGTVPMFGGKKIVRAQQSRRVTAAALKPLIEESRIEGLLIVEAGNLKTDDAMRVLFERNPSAAAIACHADEARDLDGLVREVMAANGLEIAEDAKRLLIARLGADRGLSRAEIDKLALYALGKARIELDDVEAIVGDASDLAVDRIISAAAAGRATAACREYERAISSGESPQYVMIAATRHFQRLHRVRRAVETGVSIDEAVKSLRPPVFFKQRDAFVAQVDQWSSARLDRALARISETQRLSRSGPQTNAIDEATLVDVLVLDLARLGAQQRPSAPKPNPVRR